MINIGASILTWIPKWTEAAGLFAIDQAAHTGYDLVEILFPENLDLHTKVIKQRIRKQKIGIRCAAILPPACHLPRYPRKAKAYLCKAIDLVEQLETDLLAGVLYTAIAQFSGRLRSEAEWQKMVDVLGEVAHYAKAKGISLALEPINRYETNLLTSAQEVLDLLTDIGMDNVGVHLDTFHMNIEEQNIYETLTMAGERLFHVHVCENDRGIVGKGNIAWHDFFEGLAEINYQGALVLESFSSEVEELRIPTSLWRETPFTSQQLAELSLAFLTEKASAFGLY
ncbi:MAG: sugar phosphate isomerase/epimerase family protein [Bacteroidota bacterium]